MEVAMHPTAHAAVLGILSHIFYFNRGEHHLYAEAYIKFFVGIATATVLGLRYLSSPAVNFVDAVRIATQLLASFLAGLYGSLAVYRLWLHPLGRFPGPRAARLSSLYMVGRIGHACHTLLDLHAQYGPYVRTGSSDLSVIDPHAVEAIYGTRSPCTKDPWYDWSHGNHSLNTHRDPVSHHIHRRAWSPAFSDKMVRGYELRARVYRQKLVEQLRASGATPVDLHHWISLYSFDVMGDLAFGKSFGCLETGEEHWVVTLLKGSMVFFGIGFPVWVFLTIRNTPGLMSDFWKLVDWCAKRFQQRLENEPEVPDISAALIGSLRGKPPTPDEIHRLNSDARVVLIAGSDTTANALTAIFYLLAHHPHEIEKLRRELEPYRDADPSAGDEFLHSQIAQLPHLNGVINEGLRLFPAVPGTLPRKTPPEGIVVQGVRIPGDITVYCPQWVMARSAELSYAKPFEFIPERWYSRPELIRNKSAFIPFSIGPYNCVGRPLALLNMRTTIARLITSFDIELGPGETKEKFLRNVKDCFVMELGSLNLTLSPRGGA
ncbi:cytochrome P450 [Aspergillus affinis]|uniref:cytochrome P450 n=1 Tax=Aspergillus affinis TaxID=1070780 RepID=UPI0022FE7807|nr:cytochrome P450 [Aspergillus affinis]KAI9037120.1 cytochrome P450 [Aspergillus affinis]